MQKWDGKCPDCKSSGERSVVRERRAAMVTHDVHMTSSPNFYDEDGKYHKHDKRPTTIYYKCNTMQHEFSVSTQEQCWCGWGQDTLLVEGDKTLLISTPGKVGIGGCAATKFDIHPPMRKATS